MSDKQIVIKEPGTYTFLTGTALPQHHDRKLDYAGRIDSPQQFLDKKKESYKPEQSTVLIDTDAGRLTLSLNEHAHNFAQVIGQLEPSTELDPFHINADQKFQPKALAKLVKLAGYLFQDVEQQRKLYAQLMQFSASVTKVINDLQKDDTGDRTIAIETKVATLDLLKEFKLRLPLFKGEEPLTVRIDIGIDASSGSVLLFLYSGELLELDYQERRRLLKAQATYFETWGCSVLYKS